MQLLKSADERLLGYVVSVIDGTQNSHQSIVQPILIARNQIAKRMRLAVQALSNEFLIGSGHVSQVTRMRRFQEPESSREHFHAQKPAARGRATRITECAASPLEKISCAPA